MCFSAAIQLSIRQSTRVCTFISTGRAKNTRELRRTQSRVFLFFFPPLFFFIHRLDVVWCNHPCSKMSFPPRVYTFDCRFNWKNKTLQNPRSTNRHFCLLYSWRFFQRAKHACSRRRRRRSIQLVSGFVAHKLRWLDSARETCFLHASFYFVMNATFCFVCSYVCSCCYVKDFQSWLPFEKLLCLFIIFFSYLCYHRLSNKLSSSEPSCLSFSFTCL